MAREARPTIDWTPERLRPARLSAAVYEVLERLIAGQPPGSRLPTERQLAEQLGVSRTSVREAVYELELKRLVERRSGRGTVILDPGEAGPYGVLLGELGKVDQDLAEVMDFRLAMEPPVAGLAAQRATRGDLARLAAILAEMRGERQRARTAELDYAFHAAVARATHNRLMGRLHEVSAEWLRASRREALQTRARREASLAGHGRIYDAIKARDQEAARAAMADHVEQVRTIIGGERRRT